LKGGETLKKRVKKKKHAKKPVGEMAEPYGEAVPFSAFISGEIKPVDIPVAPGVDVDAIKEGDDSSLEIVVEVPSAKSKRGWLYQPQAIKDIVNHVNKHTLSGFLGHQKKENLDTEFPVPVVHWVGASWKDDKNAGYFRGVIDPVAKDLKRWIKAKRVKEVSIYGMPKLKKVSGETSVVGYSPLSIDFVPIGRPGMPTRIVATGEIDDVTGEYDGTHEELKTLLKEAVITKLGITVTGPNSDYLYIENVWDDRVVVQHESKGVTKYYEYPYSVLDDVVTLGNKKEVVRKEVYEPVGEMNKGVDDTLTWQEYVSKLKTMLQSGEVSAQQICGEMGWNAEQLAKVLDPDWAGKVTGEMAVMGEIRKTVTGENPAEVIAQTFETLNKVKAALGVTGEMDVVAVATEAAKAVDTQKKAGFTAMIDGVIKEKVAGEMAQKLIGKMLNVADGATKEQIAGEIDTLLADETIKATIAGMHIDTPPPVGGTGSGGSTGVLRKRTSSI
jgi:hypothetical protein